MESFGAVTKAKFVHWKVINLAQQIIKVLQVNAGSNEFGGVSSFLFNLYQQIDRSHIQFVFLSPNATTYSLVRDEIKHMNGKIIELGAKGNFLIKNFRLVSRLRHHLKSNQYDYIHINSGSVYFNWIIMEVAKASSRAQVIVHSHNGGSAYASKIKQKLVQCLKPIIEKKADYLFACSEKAGIFMFSSKAVKSGKVRLIHNGIDSKRFFPNEVNRVSLRKNEGLTNKFVIGNIGRLSKQKNQLYLIDIFHELHQKHVNTELIIYGDGELKEDIYRKVDEYDLGSCVQVRQPVRDIENAYSVMDIFILPSIYEGLPLTGIEAQAMGLPVVFSDSITREVDISGKCEFIGLDKPVSSWVSAVEKYMFKPIALVPDLLKKNGYDMVTVAKDMTRFYIDHYRE